MIAGLTWFAVTPTFDAIYEQLFVQDVTFDWYLTGVLNYVIFGVGAVAMSRMMREDVNNK